MFSNFLNDTLILPLEKANGSWMQWLTPVIIATQEAEILRIIVQYQTGQKINS
jgi:hypothetical protein